jgi:GT2 family glycosyltransferase
VCNAAPNTGQPFRVGALAALELPATRLTNIFDALESPIPPLAYSLVIATFERPEDLEITLFSVLAQSRLPREIVVVDSSRDERTSAFAGRWNGPCPLRYRRTGTRSAARQRNEGAALVDEAASPVIGFMDDDITLYPDACAKVLAIFDADSTAQTGGVAVRLEDFQRPEPRGWLWWYYRLQAGFSDRTYGARLFGPVINCLPSYTEGEGDLVAADWLNSGCVFYRTALFQRERFPAFEGYSFMEDVHLSARIARTHRLYFHKSAICRHRDGSNSLKRDVKGIARQRIRNQRLVARDVLGLSGAGFEAKLLLHKLFVSIAVIRRRDRSWKQELLGTWT